MEIEHVKMFEELCDEMHELFHALDTQGRFASVKKKLKALQGHLPADASFAFAWEMRLMDNNNKKLSIPYYEMGITTDAEGGEPYHVEGVSTLATYILNGEPIKIPHDRCPNCWDFWDFKFLHPTCEHCGISLGKEVKQLLDDGLCPNCEQGKVGPNRLLCDKCGKEVPPDMIVWG